jgi:hypothetical protein
VALYTYTLSILAYTMALHKTVLNEQLPYCNVLGGSIHDGTLLHYKSQYITVKHSQQLFEHVYTSDLYGLGTLTPIEFSQRDLLWQSSNTHSNSCSQKASIHTLGQSIVGLSVHLHSTTLDFRYPSSTKLPVA